MTRKKRILHLKLFEYVAQTLQSDDKFNYIVIIL